MLVVDGRQALVACVCFTLAIVDMEAAIADSAKARVGEVLRGKWHLDTLIGIGGMASVYAATHRNKKRGAVKLLHRELAANTEVRQRFLREGYMANTVDHPGVVSVLDDDVAEDGSVFLVMELLDGRSLEAVAEQAPGQRLAPAEVVRLMHQLLDVLASAHERGIVHRDLKPENLFLTREGHLKVLDFGIARLRDGAVSSHVTKTGTLIGTPAFLPPEQACGYWDRVDARSDIWAVGAVMFTLLTGRHVHQADTLNTLLLAAMTKPAPRLADALPGASPELVQVVDRALAFGADDRWPNARAMQRALQPLMDPTHVEPSSAPTQLSASDRVQAPTALSAPASVSAPAVSDATVSPVSSDPVLPRRKRLRASAAWIGGGAVFAALGVLALTGSLTLGGGGKGDPEAVPTNARQSPDSTHRTIAPADEGGRISKHEASDHELSRPEVPRLWLDFAGVTF